jgi:hypothetical protein
MFFSRFRVKKIRKIFFSFLLNDEKYNPDEILINEDVYLRKTITLYSVTKRDEFVTLKCLSQAVTICLKIWGYWLKPIMQPHKERRSKIDFLMNFAAIKKL